MKRYDITFIDEKTNREFGFDDLRQLNFNTERTGISCKNADNSNFFSIYFPGDYTKIIIEEVDYD